MGKISYYIVLAVVLVASFFSCTNAEKQQQIAKIDSLIAQLDSTGQKLALVDTAKASGFEEKIISDLAFVQANYKDTMPKEMAIKLGNYHRHHRLYGKLKDNVLQAGRELEELQIQLANLKTDITNNQVPKGKFPEYFKAEQRDVLNLISLVGMIENSYPKAYKKHTLLEQQAEEIIQAIKQNKKDSVQ